MASICSSTRNPSTHHRSRSHHREDRGSRSRSRSEETCDICGGTKEKEMSPRRVGRPRIIGKARALNGKSARSRFLNFLRQYRKRHGDWLVTKVAAEGARVWSKMNGTAQAKYRVQARRSPKRRQSNSISRGNRRGRSCEI